MGYADLIARERMPDRMVDVELAHSQSQKGMGLGFYRAGAGNDAGRGKWDIVGEHMQILSVALAPGEQLESEPGGMMYMSDGVKAEADFSCPGACVRCLGGEKCVLMHYKNAGGKPGFVGITPARPADIVALDCVEINQCVGCMTLPSWLGRAVGNRHRHAVEQALRRWRGRRRDDSERAVNFDFHTGRRGTWTWTSTWI